MFDLEAFITTFGPAFKDIVTSCTAIVAVYIAGRGLHTWNRQLRGTAQYELARRVLRATYRLRDALDGVRNPVIWGAEMPDPPKESAAEMSRREQRHWGIRQAYAARWDLVSKHRSELQAELLEAEVLWGHGLPHLVKPLHALQTELFTAVETHLLATDPAQGASRSIYVDLISKRRQVLYDRSDDDGPDHYRSELLEAVAAIERYCSRHLGVDRKGIRS